jgi:hypothetical protein
VVVPTWPFEAFVSFELDEEADRAYPTTVVWLSYRACDLGCIIYRRDNRNHAISAVSFIAATIIHLASRT